jgi:Tetratricopeptide repeat/Bacterial SH3 domain
MVVNEPKHQLRVCGFGTPLLECAGLPALVLSACGSPQAPGDWTFWTAVTCRRFPRARRAAPTESGLVRLVRPHSTGKASRSAMGQSCGLWPGLDRYSRSANLWRFGFWATVILAFWLLGGEALAQKPDIDQLFRSGNQHYADGDFKTAIQQYEKIVTSSFVSEVVYYNLGNAYFKDGQLGKAILYYEKAHRLSSGDREIRDNLGFAKTRISDKVEKPPEGFLLTQSRRLLNLLPLDVETFLAVICFVAANGCFTLFVLGPSPSLSRLALYAAFGLLALFLLFGASNLFRIYQSETTREGVILTDKVDVLSGPSTDNPTLFSIHEGLKVRIENEVQDWLQISLENGWNGWVKRETLGMI